MATETHERTDIHVNDLAGPNLRALAAKAPIAAAVGLVLSLIGLGIAASSGHYSIFFQSYLIGFMFWFGVTMGSTMWLLAHHVTGGGWGFMLRRPLEAATRNWPLVVILWIPLVIALILSMKDGHNGLYVWADPNVVAADPILQKKIGWLNPTAWIIRGLIYFGIWFLVARYMNKMSKLEDETDDPWVRHKVTNMAARVLVLMALTITFAVIDWVMSIEPHWYSSLFGFIFIVGQGHSTLCLMFVLIRFLAGDTPLVKSIEHRYFRDIGNLLLAFTLLWAYTNYSQYMIQYSGNMEEDAGWFLHRGTNGWEWFGLGNIIFHFAAPFLFLLMSITKVNMKNLAKFAMCMIVARHIDLMFYVAPTFRIGGPFSAFPASIFSDFGCTLMLGGIWLTAWSKQMLKANAPVVPQYDARLEGYWPLPEPRNGNGNGKQEVPAHV